MNIKEFKQWCIDTYDNFLADKTVKNSFYK